VTTAANNVQVSVKFSGVDGVSKSARSAQQSVERFGKSAAEAADKVGSTSGRLSTTLSSLGDFAGRSEGAFRTASEAAGAFDDVLALLPGPAGIATAAVAGLTTVLVLQAREAEQTRQALLRAYGPDIAGQVARVAAELDLTREAQVALGAALRDTGKSAADVQLELQAIAAEADAVGSDGSAAVIAFANNLSQTATSAAKLTNRLRALGVEIRAVQLAESARGTGQDTDAARADEAANKRTQELTEQLERQRKTLEALQKGEAGQLKTLRDRTSIFDRFAGVLSSTARINQRYTDAARADLSTQRELAGRIAATEAEIRRIDETRTAASESLTEAQRVEREETARLAEEEFAEAAAAYEVIKAKGKLTTARKGSAQAARAEQQAAAAVAEAARLEAENLQILTQLRQRDDETRILVAEAARAQAKTATEQIAAERTLAAERLNADLRRLEERQNDFTVEQYNQRLAALKAINAAQLAETVKGIEDRQRAEADAARQAAAQAAQQQLDAAVQAVAAVRQEIGALDSLAGNVLATLPQIGAAVAVGFSNAKDSILSATQLAGAALVGLSDAEGQRAAASAKSEEERAKALEAAERRKAGILALVSAATAALEFARGNYPGAAAAAAAAIQYGAIAGGVVSRASSGAATAGAGATTGTGETLTTAAADTGASTAAINVSFGSGFVIGTQQQIGQAIAGSLRSLRTTGLATAGGV
jgi:hypothetical protein